MPAKIYTDKEGLLVFEGFTCEGGVVSGGDNLGNDLFLAFLKAAYIDSYKIGSVAVIGCHFIGNDWVSQAMERLMKRTNDSKPSTMHSPSETPLEAS